MTAMLLVDDDCRHAVSIQQACDRAGIEVHRVWSRTGALRMAGQRSFGLAVVTDRLANLEGYSLAHSLRPIPTVVCSEALTSRTVFDAVSSGAYDCLSKPLEVEELEAILARLDSEASEAEVVEPAADLPDDPSDVIVGRSSGMISAYRTGAAAAQTHATVLVRGESGTGKELLARSIHDASGRTGAFVALNCAAIVDTLAESELFGHEKGAFTGATDRRPGAFETADGGTLFLDEIGDSTPAFLAKLLRALDQGEFYRVGGREAIRPDVRIVAATNQDLESAVEADTFRADLFYRLCEVTIDLPPLRDRLGDIPVLSRGLIRRIARRFDCPAPGISKLALEKLARHQWPGNVRELQNVLTRAMILANGAGIVESVIGGIEKDEEPTQLGDVERQRVVRALDATGWHRGKACELLGITRPTLRRKMREYGIEKARSGRTYGG